jgi:hypothetical protein
MCSCGLTSSADFTSWPSEITSEEPYCFDRWRTGVDEGGLICVGWSVNWVFESCGFGLKQLMP